MKWVAVDLDGCISDHHRRRHLEAAGDFDQYHRLAPHDEVMNAEMLVNPPDDVIRYIVTGRPEEDRAQTVTWLVKHFGRAVEAWRLLMRPGGDKTPSAQLKLKLLMGAGLRPIDCVGAYDDRADVIRAYKNWGIPEARLWIVDGQLISPYAAAPPAGRPAQHPVAGRPRTAAEILDEMAKTFRERNAEYKNNYKMIAQLVRVLFPDGVPPELVVTDQWHIFELKLVKLSRFAISGLAHVDSIHDDGVYSAMIQSILEEQQS